MLVVVALGVALGVLLAVPLELAFQLERVEALRGQLTVRWLFGLVRVHAAVPRARPSPPSRAPAPRTGRARPPPKARAGPARFLAVLRQVAFRRRVQRLAGELLRAVHVRRLRVSMRLGLGDPADTGCLWALVGPLGAAAQGLRGVELWIEPEFVEPGFELQAGGRVRVVPLRALAIVSRFALSPASLRALWTLRGGHA